MEVSVIGADAVVSVTYEAYWYAEDATETVSAVEVFAEDEVEYFGVAWAGAVLDSGMAGEELAWVVSGEW